MTFAVDGHNENWLVKSQTFKRYLAKGYFDAHGKALSSEGLSAAINLLEAKAIFEGEEHPVYVRLAEHDGIIYLDLCNSEWQAVQVTPQGWSVVDAPPVRFRRAKGMLPLPVPVRGGNIEMMREFLNVDDITWTLAIAWLIAAYRPKGPFPILTFFAEHGAAKSTGAHMLRDLVDPNTAPLRSEPRSGRDLMIAANNSWCQAFDNLSHISPWFSDAVCRLSTGGGWTTRELYTDQDEVIFSAQRPVILNGIGDLVTRPDLLDRSILGTLPAIPEEKRRAQAELLEAFHRVRPQILGALLDAVSTALLRMPTVKLPNLPRMADFAIWVTAAEPGLDWADGTFMKAYRGNRESANDMALEASVVARHLLELLESEGKWSGTAKELLAKLEGRLSDPKHPPHGWPKSPRAMTGHLTRLAPNLRAVGWDAVYTRTPKKRGWVIRSVIASSYASHDGPCESMPSDADLPDPGPADASDANDANPGDWNPDRF